jgi:hypothetical protein
MHYLMLTRLIAGSLLALMGGGPLAAAEVDVDLELVLAVDVSRSMDYEEQTLQREGYVVAIKHPEVVQAIGSGQHGRIAITYVQWSGPFYHAVIAPWTIIANQDDAEAFSQKIAAAPILRESSTSISTGLFFSSGLFAESGANGTRRAIDISGDGPNNTGIPVAPMRDYVISKGITINGLPIVLKQSIGHAAFSIPNLDVYYEDCVIGGPGAFMITVDDLSRLEVAIKRKLVLEIAGRPARVLRAAAQRSPRVDCLIGEKSRGNWFFQEPAQR